MTPEQRRKLHEIYERYGRPMRLHGRSAPMRCKPSAAEKAGAKPSAAESDNRVIFDTEEKARAAIAALLSEGALPHDAYQCPRSTHDHWHICRTDRLPAYVARKDGDPR